MVGVMVAVGALQRLDTHAEEAAGLPLVGAELHLPRRRRMAQNVRRDIGHPGGASIAPEGLIYVLHRVAVPFDIKPLSPPFPAPQMRQ
jgi:hypothetical protein